MTDSQPQAVPSGARAICGIQLTTHEGHVMGAARSNIVVFENDGQAFIRGVVNGTLCSGTSSSPTAASARGLSGPSGGRRAGGEHAAPVRRSLTRHERVGL